MTSLLKKTQEANKIYQELQELEAFSRKIYWQKAEYLYFLKNKNQYKNVFGDGVDSWAAFLAEVHIPRSSADQKVDNWKFFVEKHGFDLDFLSKADSSVLYAIATKRRETPKEELQELIEKSIALSRGDFLQTLKGVECAHDQTTEEAVFKCVNCGVKTGTKKKNVV